MADLVLFNANGITMDSRLPRARLIAIRKGKISWVGDDGGWRRFAGQNTSRIDCRGRTVLPGFIDPHFHLHAFVESLVTLDLSPRRAGSIGAIQDLIRKRADTLPPGSWIKGRGYHEFDLAEKRSPTRRDLDEAAPRHPVRLIHRSGSATVLNSLAMKRAGLSMETPDPPAGLMERDLATGELTGVLFGMEEELAALIPPLDPGEIERGVRLADRALCAAGITSLQDASARNDPGKGETVRAWRKGNLLRTRVTMMLGRKAFRELARPPVPDPEEPVSFRGVKIVLGQTTGRLHPPQSELDGQVLEIHQAGAQAVLHAVEEGAIESACRSIERALGEIPRADHRHRIEHCSVCPPPLARRLALLGVRVVTQPSFIHFHGDRYLAQVPPAQLPYLYPVRTLMQSGVRVAGSSDCPVVAPDPLAGIGAAIFRRTETGNLCLPAEAIQPMEALGLFTLSAAQAAFEEGWKGVLAPGYAADLVVLSADPTDLSFEKWGDLRVEMTILNGEVVWDS